MKTLVTIAVLLFNYTIASTQTNLLLQNVNIRAKELKHGLNSSGDSLLLSGERTIFKVEIFNENFSKTINVSNSSVRIPLNDLPLGRLVVEAGLKDKLIIITLLRQSEDSALELTHLSEPISMENLKSDIIEKEQHRKQNSIAFSTNLPRATELIKQPKIPKSYWIEYIISNGNSSYKTLRFANKSLVDKMVAKNRIEIKSVKGKLNDLTVWEIYDTTKFLRFKRRNPDFSKVSDSDFFNVTPYYASQTYLMEM
jgi:hypothetical protein